MPRATRSRKLAADADPEPAADADPEPAAVSPPKRASTRKKTTTSRSATAKPATRTTKTPTPATESPAPKTSARSTRSTRRTAANPTPSTSSAADDEAEATTDEPTAEATPPPQPKRRARPPKRSLAPKPARQTRSSTAHTPEPAAAAVHPADEPAVPDQSTVLVPSTPEPAQKEPSISPQSSNAENRTPAHPPSSPPVQQSTPKSAHPEPQPRDSSDAEHALPPPLNSQQRPRLQELEARTLLPLDDDEPPLPSPTPRRRKNDPRDAVTAHPFEVGGEVFHIYSDSNTPGTPVAAATPTKPTDPDVSSTQLPPMSSPGTPTPRKRAQPPHSDAEDTVVESPKRRRTRKTDAAKDHSGKNLTTEELKSLMPARRRKKKIGASAFDISSDEDASGSEDELARPVRRLKTAGKPPKAQPGVPAAKITKSAWSRPLTKQTPRRTYARRSAEAEGKGKGAEQEANPSSELTPPPPSSSDATIEMGDGELDREARRKLREMKKKFEEVDRWEMEFETVSEDK